MDIGHAIENARAFGRALLEQQPGNRGRIGGAAFQTAGDHFTTTMALPSRTGVVNADFSVILGVGEQSRRWRHEIPTGAVPSVNLHAQRVHMEGHSISRRYSQTVAERGWEVRRAVVSARPC